MDAAGTNWRVDIEESETVPGYYRNCPTMRGTIIAEGLNWGGRLELHLYRRSRPGEGGGQGLCFRGLDYFHMGHTVPENGWARMPQGRHGRSWRRDNNLSAQCVFGIYRHLWRWMLTSFNDGVRIALPGARLPLLHTLFIDFCQVSSGVGLHSLMAPLRQAVGGGMQGILCGR